MTDSGQFASGKSLPEALVLGGGIAGSTVAILLARAGRPVTLLEQNAGPHDKVCGEFLSAEALYYLRLLGLDSAALEALGAVPITHLRLATGRTVVCRPLPFRALSLSRRTLDEALLEFAVGAGATVRRGAHVQALTWRDAFWEAELRPATGGLTPGDELLPHRAPTAFLATGKHDLRGYRRPRGRQNSLIAFKQYFRLAPREAASLGGHVELALYRGGYTGLQTVEGGRANLSALIDCEVYRSIGGTWASLVDHMTSATPHLGRRLAGAETLLEKPLALANLPYGLLFRSPPPDAAAQAAQPPGLWRLGDQTAVIPSLSGDGMSIALHTAHLAAQIYLAGGAAADLEGRLHGQLRRQVGLATRISQTIVAPAAHPLIEVAGRVLPSLLPFFARATRISDRVLVR